MVGSLHQPLQRAIGFVKCPSCHQVRRATTHTRPSLYDIIIVGGGIAGLILKSALKNRPETSHLRTALLEANSLLPARRWAPPTNEYANRCSSITPGTLRFLQEIHVKDQIMAERLQEYARMRVWDGITGARIRFGDSLGDETCIATMTENINLQHACLQSIGEDPDVIDGVRVESIAYGRDEGDIDLTSWPVVQLQSGERMAARLLIGADGANSPVRTFAEIDSSGWDYGRVGLVATMTVASARSPRAAFQRFLPSGPIAYLPVSLPDAVLICSSRGRWPH